MAEGEHWAHSRGPVGAGADADLDRIDSALMRLRRFWSAPRGRSLPAGTDEEVELSTVLVVEVLAREADAASPAPGVAEVAQRLDVAPSTASRLVDRAVAAGMVQRRTSAGDARRAALHLTEQGEALHERARSFRTDYLRAVVHNWDPAEVAALGHSLDRFARAVGDRPLDAIPHPLERT
jgi:DNA-binding MarR family transcriptional regulator